jgi:hypothetical protein
MGILSYQSSLGAKGSSKMNEYASARFGAAKAPIEQPKT